MPRFHPATLPLISIQYFYRIFLQPLKEPIKNCVQYGSFIVFSIPPLELDVFSSRNSILDFLCNQMKSMHLVIGGSSDSSMFNQARGIRGLPHLRCASICLSVALLNYQFFNKKKKWKLFASGPWGGPTTLYKVLK